ncbi:DUF4839 domain-containing protein [Nocardioides sp. LS1]|uniref:DUF4839 domain-containing protein n=1 Tax=Nocardioides sp. LS1 TaxID=1027620 RepID=UPI000F622E44|nr:DUF4839 domain-containing protein [Nocardioides sp. LS1]GCD89920.1 hypothetical protein NLS1_19260 [Nocardioides sp. LS1]
MQRPAATGITCLILILLLATTACTDDQSAPVAEETPLRVAAPDAAGDLEGDNYGDVVDALTAAGFTNVDTEVIPDLITGWLVKDGEVESVTVDGVSDFESGDEFDPDVDVVVAYHTFPEEGADDEPSETPSASPADEPTETASAAPVVLTPENNAELAAMLKVDPCEGKDFEFAQRHEGETIAFDGSVGAMAHHGNYDTRYDILIGPGDKGPNTVDGPTFQFRDVNMLDLNFVGRTPNRFGVGDKAEFTADVAGFSRSSCLFFLEPVETRMR